jgi:hypothetical protein
VVPVTEGGPDDPANRANPPPCPLYLQAGLGDSALRAGATYLPMAAVFGLAGYHWRRLRAAARRVIVPAGLAVSAAA